MPSKEEIKTIIEGDIPISILDSLLTQIIENDFNYVFADEEDKVVIKDIWEGLVPDDDN